MNSELCFTIRAPAWNDEHRSVTVTFDQVNVDLELLTTEERKQLADALREAAEDIHPSNPVDI